MSEALQINKPTPSIAGEKIIRFDSTSDVRETIYAMKAGASVLITEFYSNGMLLLKELHKHLSNRLPNKTFTEQRAYRAEYHKLSNQILLEITAHQVEVHKAPKIGWIEKLYPDTPNLFDHLILIDNWLKRYEGPKKSAIDIGIGSGVLSFQMLQHGFQKVFGTDTNPNAIVGLKEFMGETKLSRKIDLHYGNLFAEIEKETELIVFNPPWLPANSGIENMDEAIYYNKNLFPKFFAEANNRLATNGKLVILFSNLAQITKVSKEHPIEKEIAKGVRFEVEKCLKKAVKVASDKTKRNQHWRGTEEVELWVLTKK